MPPNTTWPSIMLLATPLVMCLADPAGAQVCTPGQQACPVAVTPLPFTDRRDTRTDGQQRFDGYACAPTKREGGREVVYRVDVAHLGVLTARVDDVPGDDVDVDVHLLSATAAPGACVTRDDVALRWIVRPGTWYVVVDTYVDGEGEIRSGPFTLTIDHQRLDVGRCALADRELPMAWRGCAPGVDCVERGEGDDAKRYLRTPVWGEVVKEAHLVTVDEDFGGGWPTSGEDEIARHHATSQAASGYVMARTEPWAPAGEGGSQWGQGATGSPLPVDAEAWYVNMYWRPRPAQGTRLLVMNPANGRAVVAAGGYETGPGSNTAIGGVSEEIHHHLGTRHRDALVIGFLRDQTLPYGVIACESGR